MKKLRLYFAFALSVSNGLVLLALSLSSGFAPTATLAQGNNNRPPAGNAPPAAPVATADQAWSALTALATPAKLTPGLRGPKTRAERDALWVPAASQFKQAAQAAKDFYTAFPADPRAPQAKKLEATNLLAGILATDADQGEAAFRTAAAYRADPANSAQDRFEVAAFAEAQRYSIRNKGDVLAENPAAHEAVADALHAEFGDTPEAVAYYLGVVDTADFETGYRIARKIVELPTADGIRRQAQTEIDRHSLLGKPLAASLKAQDGQRLDLNATGSVTVLYVWSERHGGGDWATLARAKPSLPSNVRWIFLALDTTPPEMAKAMRRAPFAGASCIEPGGPKGAALKTLKLRRVPFVYVIDASGTLVGYGPPALLPSFLGAGAAANAAQAPVRAGRVN